MNYTKYPNSNDLYKEFWFKPDEMMDEFMYFLKEKGMDVDTIEGLNSARKWIRTTSPKNLLCGKPRGDGIDVLIGIIRREMLLEAVEYRLDQMRNE